MQVAGRPAKANQRGQGRAARSTCDVPEPVDPAPRPEALPLADPLPGLATSIVVDKPAGMVVHPAAGHASGTLVNALLHHVDDLSGIGGEKRPGIVHRLDRGTSGLMVVAKHDAAHEELVAAVSRSRGREGVHRARLGRGAGGPADRRADRTRSGQPEEDVGPRAAQPRSGDADRPRRAPRTGVLTLAHVAIHTGRTHQIRVHLSAIGHPDRRRLAVRRRPPPRARRPSRGRPHSSGRSCTPRGWRSRTRPTAAAWSSRARCRRICSRCWTSCTESQDRGRSANGREHRCPSVYQGPRVLRRGRAAPLSERTRARDHGRPAPAVGRADPDRR